MRARLSDSRGSESGCQDMDCQIAEKALTQTEVYFAGIRFGICTGAPSHRRRPACPPASQGRTD